MAANPITLSTEEIQKETSTVVDGLSDEKLKDVAQNVRIDSAQELDPSFDVEIDEGFQAELKVLSQTTDFLGTHGLYQS